MLKISILLSFLSIAFAETDDTIYKAQLGERKGNIYPYSPPLYDINLDLSYEDRWREVMAHKRPFAISMYELFVKDIKFPEETIHNLNYSVMAAYDVEFAKELLAVSKLLDITFEQIAFLNIVFEAAPRCSGIIVQDEADNIYHARNLEFYNPEFFGQTLYEGRFWKNGELLFQAVGQVPEIGVITGMKKNKFNINFNQYDPPFFYTGDVWEPGRRTIQDIYNELFAAYENLQLLPKRHYLKDIAKTAFSRSSLMLMRRTLEHCETFEEAVEAVRNTPMFTKGIFIVSGTKKGEGVVIVRKRDRIDNEVYLNPDKGIWYLVATNYRRDIYDPPHDNRRSAAEVRLKAIGRKNITPHLLFEELTKYPLLNNATMHTTIMQASTGKFETIIWGWQKDAAKTVDKVEEGTVRDGL